ncbi:MAG: UBP-type zinc finger domain-containing protein [Gemmatimonadetes bacterium]|nr:UBP-type zinc finger domain-containing protein [Gemmatimonadota bacterium]
MAQRCTHLADLRDVEPRTPNGCEECLAIGSRWVHLRLCLTCGHVGCCDNSPNRHATKHFHQTKHPVMRSFETGEDWAWCYVDKLFIEPAPRPL